MFLQESVRLWLPTHRGYHGAVVTSYIQGVRKHYIFKVYANIIYSRCTQNYLIFLELCNGWYDGIFIADYDECLQWKNLEIIRVNQVLSQLQLSELPPLYCHIESHKSAAVSVSKGGLNVQTPTHTSKIMSK